MNITNNKAARNTIIKINKIEQIITMWKQINSQQARKQTSLSKQSTSQLTP